MSKEWWGQFPHPDQPEAAYRLEAQAIAVRQAQEEGELQHFIDKMESEEANVEVIEELGVKWIVIDGGYNLFKGNCNLPAIFSLKVDTPFLTIASTEYVGSDISFGRRKIVIAAVIAQPDSGQEQPNFLFRSPGFDLEKYYQQHSSDSALNHYLCRKIEE